MESTWDKTENKDLLKDGIDHFSDISNHSPSPKHTPSFPQHTLTLCNWEVQEAVISGSPKVTEVNKNKNKCFNTKTCRVKSGISSPFYIFLQEIRRSCFVQISPR